MELFPSWTILKRHAFPLMHPPRLSDQRARRRALVPPGVGQRADGLVVARQTVDAGLDENQAELAVLVLAVALEMLADGDGLSFQRVSKPSPDSCECIWKSQRVQTFLMSM